jgi:hypothetical protein
VAEAFDKGLSISKMPGNSSESILQHSGPSWKDWASDATTHPDELAAARLGAISWMTHELEGVRAGKKLLDTPKNPVLQEKLEALFGKDKAQQSLDLLNDTNNRDWQDRFSDLRANESRRSLAGATTRARPRHVGFAAKHCPADWRLCG